MAGQGGILTLQYVAKGCVVLNRSTICASRGRCDPQGLETLQVLCPDCMGGCGM